MIPLGICMAGGEADFLALIEKQAQNSTSFLYVEIGVAYGQTLYGVWETVKRFPGAGVVGLELPTWAGVDAIERQFAGEPFVVSPEAEPAPGRATVILERSTTRLAGAWPCKIDAAFIDACHGKPCVMADFKAVEPFVAPGGVVIFHDAGGGEQGGDIQPHCQLPIGVRDAITELGLFDNRRDGWTFEGMLPTQNQCAVFRKSLFPSQ